MLQHNSKTQSAYKHGPHKSEYHAVTDMQYYNLLQ